MTPAAWIAFAAITRALGAEPLPIPQAEREALIAIYRSAGGEHWKNHDGWLGERGTECDWHGVGCGFDQSGGPLTWSVADLDLNDNGLTGTLPPELDALSNLVELRVYGSDLAGTLPPKIRERWESGRLTVQGYASLAGVSEITLQYSSAVSCQDFEATLRSDGTVVVASERCKAKPRMKWQGTKGLGITCETQSGWTDRFGDAYGRLAWLLEKEGFYALDASYFISITHGGFMHTSVVRRGERKTVEDYAEAGPMSLWLIEAAIRGVLRDAQWEKTTRGVGSCRWTPFGQVD